LGWKQSYDNWLEYYGATTNNGVGESTLRCYTLDVQESIFHSFKFFNISLFQFDMCKWWNETHVKNELIHQNTMLKFHGQIFGIQFVMDF